MSSHVPPGLEDMQTAPLPADLAFALQSEHEARRSFAALTAAARRELLRSLDGADTPGTRRRRVARAVDALRDGAGLRA